MDPVWKSECISLHIQQKREHRENADDAHIPMKGPYSMVQRIAIPSHGLFSKFSYIKHHKCEEFAEPNCKEVKNHALTTFLYISVGQPEFHY